MISVLWLRRHEDNVTNRYQRARMTDTFSLLFVAICSIVLLTYLVVVRKVHAFIAILVAAAFVGLGTGMQAADVLASMQSGMGKTLGFVATIVGLGAMLGQFLEESGGIDRLSQTINNKFGDKNSQWAVVLTGFLVAIPVFFEVGLIILMPLIYSLAKKSGKSLIYYGIPLTAGLAVTHAFIPPTPGPVAVASILGADIGLVILFGFIVGIPCACLAGPIYATFLAKRLHVPVPNHIIEASHKKPKELPSFGSVAALLTFPLVAILVGTLAKFTLSEGVLKEALLFIGHPFIALTIATIACFKVLGKKQGLSSEQIRNIASRGLEPVALVILVTGAGGMFKQVLIDSGAGQAFADVVALSPLPPLAAGFLIAISVRIIQGSATVAMLTAAGLMGPVVQELAFSPSVLALMTIAIAAGATAMSHVNDTGFWIVNRYFDISVKDTFVSWTCMATLIGFIGLFLVLMLGLFV